MFLSLSSSSGAGPVNRFPDKPDYFDVTVWGAQGQSAAKYLRKGRPVAIDGRLEWRQFETESGERQAIEIIADTVQFLGSANGNATAPSEAPLDSAAGGDDIAF